MGTVGKIPENISLLHALDSIGETIIIADRDYNVQWMNSSAANLLSDVVPLFGISDVNELIGMNMGRFHQRPEQQKNIMDQLEGSHRARITIKDRFVADIVITSIKGNEDKIQGYVVMLMDVTTKAEEDNEKEKLLNALSVPIIKIWEKTIALTLIGIFNKNRADRVIASVLEECVKNKIQYVLVDLSGLYEFEYETKHELQKLNDSLNLIGSKCILVGITPELAMAAGDMSSNILTFKNAYSGLKHIIHLSNIK